MRLKDLDVMAQTFRKPDIVGIEERNILAARKPQGVVSGVVAVVSTVGYALPVFWTGLMLIILFASMIPVFPIEGMYSAMPPAPNS